MSPPATSTQEVDRRGEMVRLTELFSSRDTRFLGALREATAAAKTLQELLRLSALRRRAERAGLSPEGQPLRVALIGGYTLYPLNELVQHFLAANWLPASWKAEIRLGDYDNYTSEIVGGSGILDEFKPEIVLFFPSHWRCQYSGHWFDRREKQEAEVRGTAAQILDLCRAANSRTGAEIVLANFPLPGRLDPGLIARAH